MTCFKVQAQIIDYSIDPSFNSGNLYTLGGITEFVVSNADNLFVSGSFSPFALAGGYTLLNYNGQTLENNATEYHYGSSYMVKYKSKYLVGIGNINYADEFGIDTSFRFEFAKQAYSGGLPDYVEDALVTQEDNILVVGRFFTDSTLIDTPESYLVLRQLCLVDSTGAPVPDFPMLLCAQPVDAEIFTIDTLSTGEYIIAGTFAEVDGNSYSKIAKLNPDFSVNTDFSHPFSSSGSYVSVIYVDSQDRIWVFKSPTVGLDNYPDYPSLLVRLLPDGTVDPSYQVNVFTSYFGEVDNPTTAINVGARVIEDSDSTFILGGEFIEVNGEPHNRLIKIRDNGEIIEGAFGGVGPDGAIWNEWWEPGLGPIVGTKITRLLKLPDGKILIGGQFSSFGGEPYSCMVRLMPSGFVGLDEKPKRNTISITPNPARESIRIRLPDKNQRLVRVEFYDLSGRLVREVSGVNPSGEINLSNLPQGMYVVKGITMNGVFIGKVLVE